jgi:hypothetical protein
VKGIPVDTGRMRQSIQKRKIALLAAEVDAPTNYSRFVHDGTREMPARQFFVWALDDFGGRERLAQVVSRYLRALFK